MPGGELLLRDGPLTATFVPDAGMLCRSLTHEGEELLAQNDGVEAYAHAGKTMGVPLLFPWANRIAGFTYEVRGRRVDVPHDTALVALDAGGLPIHGVIAGNVAWSAVPSPGTVARSLRALLRWYGGQNAFAAFPFEHEAVYEAQLVNGRLTVGVAVRASGESFVPVAFGFHPYIELPRADRADLLVDMPSMRHLDLDERQIPTGAGTAVDAERFRLGERVFDDGFDSVAAGASFRVAGGGREVTVEFISGYPCAQLYAPGGRPVVCFEPMTAPANALVSHSGLRVLHPGDELRATFAIAVSTTG